VVEVIQVVGMVITLTIVLVVDKMVEEVLVD
jgi:hypothetical protein